MPVCRSILRWTLIGGLGLGAATLVLGPHRVGAACASIRAWGQDAVDKLVDDPTALRRQLEQLGAEYPGKIGQLRGEIAQTDRQIHQLEQDCEVSRRVVAMTTSDLDQIQGALADAGGPTVQPVSIRVRGERMDESGARAEAKRIQHIRASHQDRVSSSEHQVQMLKDQRNRLTGILAKLEHEHNDFEVKLAALDRQIDAVSRNKRLIEMAKEQAAVLAEYEKSGRVGNLGQLEGRLEQIRLEQEAQIEVLLKVPENDSYEAAAKESIRNGDSYTAPAELPAPVKPAPAPTAAKTASRGSSSGYLATSR